MNVTVGEDGAVTSWTCPECSRRFGREGQGHDCAPALTLEEYFATGPAFERPVFEVVRAHLEGLGPIDVEPVSVGIFFKRRRTVVQLRPMTRWVAVGFILGRRLESPRLSRKVIGSGARWWHVVNVREPSEVDDELRSWLAEAYLADGPAPRSASRASTRRRGATTR
jgi:hypothetical protein